MLEVDLSEPWSFLAYAMGRAIASQDTTNEKWCTARLLAGLAQFAHGQRLGDVTHKGGREARVLRDGTLEMHVAESDTSDDKLLAMLLEVEPDCTSCLLSVRATVAGKQGGWLPIGEAAEGTPPTDRLLQLAGNTLAAWHSAHPSTTTH